MNDLNNPSIGSPRTQTLKLTASIQFPRLLTALTVLLILAASLHDARSATREASAATTTDEVVELDWDRLIPEDWAPEKLMDEYNADELSDDDPRAQELMEKLQTLWKEAPVVPELDGMRVKLPGFVVPLEMDTETIGEFLLVPYYGACIHVPPPPANQTVHVVTVKGGEYKGELFDTVWVTGTLKVERLSIELAEAGYRIQDAQVEPYRE